MNRTIGNTIRVQDRLVLTVEEARMLLGLSRGLIYEAIRKGQIPSLKIGRRILVPKAGLQRLLEGCKAEQNPTKIKPETK